MKINSGIYIQAMNDIVQTMEATGEAMNSSYEIVRNAIDQEKTTSLTEAEVSSVASKFAEGTKVYHELLTKATKLNPPIKVIGVHKKFVKNFTDYVKSCDTMEQAVSSKKEIDIELFNQSEKIQDEKTETLSFCIQKITTLMMKK